MSERDLDQKHKKARRAHLTARSGWCATGCLGTEGLRTGNDRCTAGTSSHLLFAGSECIVYHHRSEDEDGGQLCECVVGLLTEIKPLSRQRERHLHIHSRHASQEDTHHMPTHPLHVHRTLHHQHLSRCKPLCMCCGAEKNEWLST